ncbi:ABC transporter ATP-binding protein [Anaeromicropila herbilytica]|uniref:ABC transporter n=1 Tax=Anaeromicropila herbilytica TaxID=2785025 RepID=A0A7R7ID47_9FIRM|nr:ABC transporter ATP-binding protein [Anaeromicropila herbilytica]BCN30649.1 ABC transporter [Anaeromicropila herbilytica]
MNLLLAYPDGREKDDVIYSLPYDIDQKCRKVNGHCVFTSTQIEIYRNNEKIHTYHIDDFDEIICEQLIGSSMLLGKKGEQTKFLCAFSQKFFLRYAEISKLLDYYKRTGELLQENDEDEPTCPKCGLPLDGAPSCPFCGKKSDYLIRLIKRTGPYKWYFIAAVICTIVTEAVWVFLPYLQRILIDEYITPMKNVDSGFIMIAATMILSVFFVWGLEYINMKSSFKVALSVGRDLRQDVFSKAQQLSMTSISKRTAGELINRVNHDAMKLQDFITANGKDAIVKLISVVILGIILISMNFKLALLVILPIPFVALFVSKLFNTLHIRYGRVWRYRTRYSSVLHDILNGIRVVKSYGTEEMEIRKYQDASEKWMKSAISAEVIWSVFMPIAQFLLTIGNFLMLYAGGKMVLNEQLSLGELVQYTTYVAMIYGPLTWMLQIPRLLADTAVSSARVFEILDEESDVKDKSDAISMDIHGDITFDDVYFGYKAYKPVLKGINCNIKEGEMIGIVGHSGVGKSTMINLILRLYDCTGGRILIDGVDIKDIAGESLRSKVGVVLQETFLFDGSVYDNISYAKPDATFEEIIKAAKVANAHDFIVKLPDGYNTRVGDKGYSLSGGERQRIAIARAILHNPRILILDEATASLDTQTEKQIQEALNRLIKGRTTIAIAHRLSTLSNADRLIVLDQGKLAEFGTHNELMQKKGVYYKLVMAQRQTTKMKKVVEAVS